MRRRVIAILERVTRWSARWEIASDGGPPGARFTGDEFRESNIANIRSRNLWDVIELGEMKNRIVRGIKQSR